MNNNSKSSHIGDIKFEDKLTITAFLKTTITNYKISTM